MIVDPAAFGLTFNSLETNTPINPATLDSTSQAESWLAEELTSAFDVSRGLLHVLQGPGPAQLQQYCRARPKRPGRRSRHRRRIPQTPGGAPPPALRLQPRLRYRLLGDHWLPQQLRPLKLGITPRQAGTAPGDRKIENGTITLNQPETVHMPTQSNNCESHVPVSQRFAPSRIHL